ncbi:HipA N-terminal domain-containing protein [Ensifer adhaerens]|uniref:HipA N-terminal domain-containing protein n=1 Tax=Ensifer TaxID=106591 RepID=UPI001FF036D3|nr:HipA N-terminal domain-containing protein [Ensifer sp. ENS08]
MALRSADESAARGSWNKDNIACCFPFTQHEHEWKVGLHPFFQHLGPEGWLREEQARSAQVVEEDLAAPSLRRRWYRGRQHPTAGRCRTAPGNQRSHGQPLTRGFRSAERPGLTLGGLARWFRLSLSAVSLTALPSPPSLSTSPCRVSLENLGVKRAA